MPTCLATWTHTPPRRYTNNIFHQAELVVPMLSAALEAAPKAIYWQFTLLPWSRGMLEMMKGVKVIARNVTPPAHCKLFGRSSGPGNFSACTKVPQGLFNGCVRLSGVRAAWRSIVQ